MEEDGVEFTTEDITDSFIAEGVADSLNEEGVADSLTEGNVDSLTEESVADSFTESVADSLTEESVADSLTEDISDSLTERVTESLTEGTTDKIAHMITEAITRHSVSDRFISRGTDSPPGVTDTDGITDSLLGGSSNNTSTQSWAQWVTNATDNVHIDPTNSSSNFISGGTGPNDIHTSDDSELDTIRSTLVDQYNSTRSDNSTLSIALQTLKDSISSSGDIHQEMTTHSSDMTSDSAYLDLFGETTSEPLPADFTPMQKWFIATGALLGAVIFLMILNCILKCKDTCIKEFEKKRFERRVEREMERENADPTRTHMFMHA